MSVNTEHVWLTSDAYDRLKGELAALLEQRGGGSVDVTEQEQRELRIRQLHELIRTAAVHEPPDDGVAEPGMVLTVRYEGEDDTETFLMADREGTAVDGDLEICSPRSPLGQALIGSVPGELREYRTPDGTVLRVSLVEAVPHRSSRPTSGQRSVVLPSLPTAGNSAV
jgi:transcription elongation factor GreA